MQAIRILFVTLAQFALGAANACQIHGPSVEFAQKASVAAIGRAVAERESGLKKLMQVEVTEMLQGQTIHSLEAMAPCALVNVGDTVVVAQIDASWVVLPADMYEASFREATAAVRWNLEKKMHLIRKAYDALPDGGAFIAIENIIDDARRENAFGLLMSLNMLIEFGDASDYTSADFREWCGAVGFTRFEMIPLAGPSSAAVAYK